MKRVVTLVVLFAALGLVLAATSVSAKPAAGGFQGCPGGWNGVHYNGAFTSVDKNRNHWYCLQQQGNGTRDDG